MNFAFSAPRSLAPTERAHGVTAILGPTNTGKTHFAIDRMLGHTTGAIGLPLRLLAREVYNRVVERVGAPNVALITGEEKIKPPHPRYFVATVEAMPRDLDVAFVAVDEIQLAGDLDRGHVFTDRLLNRRGREETLVIGALTMRSAVEKLLPGVTIVSRPRLSNLTYAGDRKITRLPRRSAIVAFSAEEVYAIAELVRRQRGGAAVVLGALSPRTRNAQVEMYQSGDVDYIVATDAIGMGLNLDVDHVAFAGTRKFDGWQYRRLTPAEFGQIAGRAGRYVRDGTFGTTGRCEPFDEALIEALEEHRFDPVNTLQWRNPGVDFTSIEALQASLDKMPSEPGLTRAPLGEDVMVLDIVGRDPDVVRETRTRADVQRLWDACQIPDYRKVSPSAHAELVLTIFRYVVRAGKIPDDWFAAQLSMFSRTDGDIDALSARIAQVRTYTYIANRPDWLGDPEHWQGVTRQVEDNLSDALHERLAQRFVDRRTSVLMRRLRENAMLEAQVTATGDVMVEGQHVGQLHGFRFTPDPQAAGEAAKALNAAAQKALATEIEARAKRINEAVDEAFVLARDGTIRWLGEAVAKLVPGDKVLSPKARLLADDQLTGPSLDMVQRRIDLWLAQHINKLLGPLIELEQGEGLEGMARGIAFQIAEALGVLERTRVAEEVRSLDQTARAQLRKFGVRFGAYHLYLAQLLKPAPRALAAQLWALKHGGSEPMKGLEEVPHLAASGRTSFRAENDIPRGLYRAAGFRVCGERAVRVDILERLADLIRPAINYRPGVTPGAPPPGAADRDGFVVTVAMTSLAGCSGEDFASILRSLGYVVERRKGPAITVPLVPAAPTTPLTPAAAAAVAAPDEEPRAAVDSSPASAESEVAAAEAAGAPAVAEGSSEAQIQSDSLIAASTASEENKAARSDAAEPALGAASEHLSAEAGAPAHGIQAAADAAEATPSPETEPAAPDAPTDPIDIAPVPVADSEIMPAAEAAASTEVEPLAPVSAEAAPSASEPATAAEEEPLIEVWRPRRHHHHAPARRPDRRARDRRPSPDRPESQAAPIPPSSGAASDSAAEPVAGKAKAIPERREREHRHFHGRQRANERDARHSRNSGTAQRSGGSREEQKQGQRHAGRNGFEAGRGERREPRRQEGRPFATTERTREGERQPDPNSPFAKLLALKAQLESKAKEGKND